MDRRGHRPSDVALNAGTYAADAALAGRSQRSGEREAGQDSDAG